MTIGRAISRCVLVGGIGWGLGGGGLALAAPPARAIEVELPRPVPSAKLSQQVGLTEIAVDYARPAVGGRKIWGEVVSYDHPWIIGGGTKLTFSRDVTIGDKAIPAGTYWLLATPGKGSWTFMINKSPEPLASASDYKPELDVARVKAPPKVVPARERLTFLVSELTDDRAGLDLEWAGVRVSLPIQVDTTRHIEAEIRGLDDAWRAYANAARYMLETRKDYDAGLKYIDQSLVLQGTTPDWYCLWIKGALLAAKGRYGQARDLAQTAYDLAKTSGKPFPLEPELVRAIAAWRTKAGPFEKEALAATPRDAKAGPSATASPSSSPSPSSPPDATPPASASTSKAPLSDPPLLRRARLRHR